LHIWLKLNPDEIDLIEYKTIKATDMRKVSHWGTGDLQIELRSLEDLEIAKPLIERAYQEN
jgi:predicted transport protein